MKTQEIEEVMEMLSTDRTKYLYFKDKYALDLLGYAADGASIHDVKASRFAGLLRKPVVREYITCLADGRIKREDLENLWGDPLEHYLLTLGSWGVDGHSMRYHYQTTSNDANLVLQLNFSNRHNEAYRRLIGGVDDRRFEYLGHPIARQPYRTLAWSRIDLNFDQGEALIEEVQTDWMRYAENRLLRLRRLGNRLDRAQKNEYRYLVEAALPHASLWQEAILAAALWFIVREIGIVRIFYHTHASGCALKDIRTTLPPRSLYESLPRKFCFKRVEETPSFLKDKRRKKAIRPVFYLLDLGDGIGL